MKNETMSMPEIRKAGIEALLDRLGPDGTLRFLHQYNPGQGDYTSERHAWLDELTLDQIAAFGQEKSKVLDRGRTRVALDLGFGQ